MFWYPVLSLTPLHSPLLIHRSGPAVLRSHQRWDNAVQADHGGRGSVLELSGRARRTRCALHLARLLPEKVAEEVGVEHCEPRHLVRRLLPASLAAPPPSLRLRNVKLSLVLRCLRLIHRF